jgi:hypothetical protein
MTESEIVFKNEAKPMPKARSGKDLRDNEYRFDKVPELLFHVSRAFQATVSQALSYQFSGQFHTKDCGIYKAEGGCWVADGGELVLGESSCYWDGGSRTGVKLTEAADLITRLVLDWDPMDPMESLIHTAALWLGISDEKFRKGTEAARCGGVFSGNPLASFFDWNPFSDPPINAEYHQYCSDTWG